MDDETGGSIPVSGSWYSTEDCQQTSCERQDNGALYILRVSCGVAQVNAVLIVMQGRMYREKEEWKWGGR